MPLDENMPSVPFISILYREHAKYLNENKILAVTTNVDIERESYVEVTYYPNTHILISAEVVQ